MSEFNRSYALRSATPLPVIVVFFQLLAVLWAAASIWVLSSALHHAVKALPELHSTPALVELPPDEQLKQRLTAMWGVVLPLFGAGLVVINLSIAYSMLRRPSAGGARLLLILVFLNVAPFFLPPSARLVMPDIEKWGVTSGFPMAAVAAASLGTVAIVLALAWSDLLVHCLQRAGIFGEQLDQRGEPGLVAGSLRALFAATAGGCLAVHWMWPSFRPADTYAAVRMMVVGALLSLVLFSIAVAVVRRNGWYRRPMINPFPSRRQGWRDRVVDVRRALREKQLARSAATLFGALWALAAVVGVGYVLFSESGGEPHLPAFVLAVLPDIAAEWVQEHHVSVFWACSVVGVAVSMILGRLPYRGSGLGLAAATVLAVLLLTALLGFIGWALLHLISLTDSAETSWRDRLSSLGNNAPGEVVPYAAAAVAGGACALFSLLLLRGCLAVWRLGNVRTSGPRLDGRVLLRRPAGQRRPGLYASGRIISVTGFVLLSSFSWMVGLIYFIPLSFFTTSLGADSNPAFWPAKRFWGLARRYGSPSVLAVRRRDRRRPLLLLRSFKDDGLPMQPTWMFGDVLSSGAITFEESITDRLWRTGPVLAIGQPGERVPRAGAAREYVAHDAWQERVTELAREAGLICLFIGRTPGVAWEFIRLQRMQSLEKVLIVLPPTNEREASERWRKFCDALPTDAPAFTTARQLDVRSVLVIGFPAGESGPPVPLICNRRTREAYDAAVDLAGQLLPSTTSEGVNPWAPNQPPHAAGPSFRPMPQYIPPAAERPVPQMPSLSPTWAWMVVIGVVIAAGAAGILMPATILP